MIEETFYVQLNDYEIRYSIPLLKISSEVAA